MDLLQVGRNDTAGYFYYVMELADDLNAEGRVQNAEWPVENTERGGQPTPDGYVPRTLAAELQKQGRLPLERCIEIGLALTGALAHLHRQDLVHRDIKPSNIIFVGGVPKLADVGLVASVGEAPGCLCRHGRIYTRQKDPAPSRRIFTVWVFFSTCSAPERATDCSPSRQTILRSVSTGNSGLSSKRSSIAPVPDPSDRYASAEAIKTDLAALQGGRSARRHERERYWLWMRRGLISAAALAGALTLLGLVRLQAAGRALKES